MSTLSLVTRDDSGDALPAVEILITRAFRERYELQATLGSGAMGMVVRAHDRATNRPVAIKFLVKQDDELLQRFLQEGRLMARLSHPNVAPVYDLEALGGHPYIVTELLEGGTLRARMSTGLSTDEAIRVVAACLDGLAACHAAGIVHRDLKPDNVLFAADGTPKLVDLGLAKDVTSTAITKPGTFLGTPRYMAPEQVIGSGAVFASDVHAMGAILYQALAGKPPYVGANLGDTLRQIIHETPPPLDAPRPLVEIVTRALSKDSSERPDAVAFAAELRAIGKRLGRPSRPGAPARSRGTPRSRVRPNTAAVLAGVAAVACAALVLAPRYATPPAPVPSPSASAARAVDLDALLLDVMKLHARFWTLRQRFGEMRVKYRDVLGWRTVPPREDVLRYARELRDIYAEYRALAQAVPAAPERRADALRALSESIAYQCEYDFERVNRIPGQLGTSRGADPEPRSFRAGYRAAARALGVALGRPVSQFVGQENLLLALLVEVRVHGAFKHHFVWTGSAVPKDVLEAESQLILPGELQAALSRLWWLPGTADDKHPRTSTIAQVRRDLEALAKTLGKDPFGPLYGRL